MKQEELEKAVLEYFSQEDSFRLGFQSLTTVCELLPEARQLAENQYDDDEVEYKEEIRAALDQLVLDKVLESRWRDREYEASYRLVQTGTPEVDEPAAIDSALWTGLAKTRIDARNAKQVSLMIGRAIAQLNSSSATNEQIMQAAAYLKAAKELVDAPTPPSEIIWMLISKAADIIGMAGFFYTLFAPASN